MQKRINKKIVPLFFVVAALSQFSSTMPMALNPCEQPPTEKKIIDLPPDCLCEIFQFFAKHNSPQPTLKLELVCKEFKKIIERSPCFFMKTKMRNISNRLPFQYFLFFRSSRLLFDCKNEENLALKTLLEEFKKFEDSINKCPYSFVEKEKLTHYFKPSFAIRYKKGIHHRENEKNEKVNYTVICTDIWNTHKGVDCIKIYNDDALSELVNKSFFLDILKKAITAVIIRCSSKNYNNSIDIKWNNGQEKTVYFNGNSFSNKSLAIFGNIQNIEIKNSKTSGVTERILWPKNLKRLSLVNCENFDFDNLIELKLPSFNYKIEYFDRQRYKEFESSFLLKCRDFRGSEFEKIEYESIRKFTTHKISEDDLNSLKQFLINGCRKGKITRNTVHDYFRLEKKKEGGKITSKVTSHSMSSGKLK